MARGKRKETGATHVAEGKRARLGLHEGDALPELPVLHDEADNPVQLMVRSSISCMNAYTTISATLMCINVQWMLSSAGVQEVVREDGIVVFFFPKQGTGESLTLRLTLTVTY